MNEYFVNILSFGKCPNLSLYMLQTI